ncbi:hypothetical protein [Methylobacterium sp. SI9]|uniref:hypothetical protein n=1 Tax=Methylobacterium guangdongense TaxID=3138811 RepID=UPI00313AA754
MAKTSSTSSAPTIESLLEEGNGVLVKRGSVWSYPGCPNDRSGTNLVLPIESVSDAEVQAALVSGDLVAKAGDVMGGTTAVTAKPAEGEIVMTVNPMLAGSVEAATELPLNSRPTHDAGRSDAEFDYAAAMKDAGVMRSAPASRVAPSAAAASAGAPAGGTGAVSGSVTK